MKRSSSTILISTILQIMLLYTITKSFDGAKVQFYIQQQIKNQPFLKLFPKAAGY